jgi:zinc protease
MKRYLLILFACAAVLTTAVQAQLDRSKIPPPGPAPAVSFPDYDLMTTSNGMRVIVVRNTELPTITISLEIDREPVLEKAYVGYVDMAGQLMRSGTAKRTKDQLDEEIDMLGASIGAGGTSIFANGLSRHTEKLIELVSDITLHPSFPKDELEKLVMQTTSGLKFRKSTPDGIVEVVRQKLLYGSGHPYGEVETEESVGRITREKCVEMYRTFFKPNAAIMAVVGDVDKKNILALVEKYFGGWKKGTLPKPVYADPKGFDKVQVALVDRPGSVQSVIRVAQTVELPRTSQDVMPVSVMNKVLGGGGGAFRLYMNLREKHSYTYGAYSSLGPDELIGAFTVSAPVRNSVTDSALKEIFYEIRRIRDEPVESVELDRAKNSMSGSFVASLEVANTVAGYALEIERHHLPKSYYRTYLQRLAAVDAKDVKRVATQYLQPDKMLIAVVGSAKDVKEKLATFGPVTMYDEEGNVVVSKPASAVKVSVDEIFARFIEKTGGKAKYAALKDKTVELSGKMQGMEMKLKTIQKAPAKFYQEVSVMGMVQRIGYDGTKGWEASPQGIKDLEGGDLESTKTDAPIEFYSMYKQLGYKADVTGVKEIKGKEFYEVSLTSQSGPQLRHYFDTKDFLKFREVNVRTTERGPLEQTTDLFDYKDFQGYLMPTRYEQSAMGQSMTFTLDKCVFNAGVDDKTFEKPAK